ncbi:MAG: hypothetical protein ACMXYB_01725 [Candidatus Woesearchaeota archaeon]
MVQTTINLGEIENGFVEMFKAQRNLSNKNEAINKIIEEFKALKKEEFQEKMLSFECSLLSEKALAEDWLSKEDEEAFAYLQ